MVNDVEFLRIIVMFSLMWLTVFWLYLKLVWSRGYEKD
jgi:hypothetical protein